MTRDSITYSIIILASSVILASCSMTKNIPEDDQLFTGLKSITYEDYEQNDNFTKAQEEVEAALATAPNGSLLGSSYYRLPFSMGVSIWNHYRNCVPLSLSPSCAITATSVPLLITRLSHRRILRQPRYPIT